MNWDLYRIFIRLAESGSIIQAARKLNVSEPTVSRKLDQLESKMGVPLFFRGVTGVQLTREGEALFREISRVEDVLETASDTLKSSQGYLQQTVKLSTTPGLTRYWMAERVPRFASANPTIQIELRNSYQQFDLAAADIDIVLRVGSAADEDLVGHNVGRLAFGFFATEEFVERHDLRSVSPDALARVPGVLPPIDTARARRTSRAFDAYLTQEHLNNQIISESISVQKAAVEAGTHCACMPLAFCRDIRASRLPIEAQPITFYSDLWLLRRRESQQRKGVTLAFDFLRKELSASQDFFLGN